MTQALNTAPSPREISERVNALLLGRINTVGLVMLTANVATTVVNNANAHQDSAPLLIPRTANAAAENWYISARAKGSFTITHANAATTDRSFIYVFLG